MLENESAEEVNELIEERDLTLEAVLREIMFGKLDRKKAYGYRRALEVVAAEVGKPLADEVTLPGRGWQDIAPIWKRWGAPVLASLWGRPSFAWPMAKMNVEWPIAYVIPRAKAAIVKKELTAFRAKKAVEKGIPRGIPRFSEGQWPIEDLADELVGAANIMRKWCKGDVLVWHDGQQ